MKQTTPFRVGLLVWVTSLTTLTASSIGQPTMCGTNTYTVMLPINMFFVIVFSAWLGYGSKDAL